MWKDFNHMPPEGELVLVRHETYGTDLKKFEYDGLGVSGVKMKCLENSGDPDRSGIRWQQWQEIG